MLFRKKGGRRKEVKYKWNDEVLEMLKKFDYLCYMIKGNNSELEHIKKIKGKTNGMLGRLWSIAGRKCRDAWGLG